jgi:Uma2 family endonuclease
MSTAQVLLTAEQFAEMSFDTPAELIRGEVVEMPTPDQAHGCVCVNVIFAIRSWIKSGGTGLVTANDSGVITERDPDSVRGADVCYFSMDRVPGGSFRRRQIDLVPNICVEVLSEFDRWSEVRHKVNEFLDRGVDEVWIVNPKKRDVQIFRADEPPVTFTEQMELTSGQMPGFACPVEEFFDGV